MWHTMGNVVVRFPPRQISTLIFYDEMVHDSYHKIKEEKIRKMSNTMCVASYIYMWRCQKKLYSRTRTSSVSRTYSSMSNSIHTDSAHQIVIIGTEPEAKRNKTQKIQACKKNGTSPMLKKTTTTTTNTNTTNSSILITKYERTCVF